jgi:hypothetical protein
MSFCILIWPPSWIIYISYLHNLSWTRFIWIVPVHLHWSVSFQPGYRLKLCSTLSPCPQSTLVDQSHVQTWINDIYLCAKKGILVEGQAFCCCRLIGFTVQCTPPLPSANGGKLYLYKKYLRYADKNDKEKGKDGALIGGVEPDEITE